MITNLKRKIAILLVVAMVFTNAGVVTFASSVDNIVDAAKNTEQQKGDTT